MTEPIQTYVRGYDDPGYKTCPNEARHTPHPVGYLANHEWMAKMAKTHKQTRCPDCKRWAIWVPKPTAAQLEAQRDPL